MVVIFHSSSIAKKHYEIRLFPKKPPIEINNNKNARLEH